MKELSKEKTLKHLAHMFKCYEYNFINVDYKPPEEETQVYRQICQIIELHFDDDWQVVKKELGKFMQKQKPTVTEEFVQEAIDYIADFPSYKRLEKKLNEAGVEVKKNNCEHDWVDITAHDEKHGNTYRCKECGEEKFEPFESDIRQAFIGDGLD